MMKTISIAFFAAILGVACYSQGIQDSVYVVNLKVAADSKFVSPPSEITLTLGKHSTQVPVLDGRFIVPKEIALAKQTANVSVSTVVRNDEIHLSVKAGVLKHEYWTLRLADEHFEDQYQSLIQKGQNSRSVCVLEFANQHSDASVLVAPHCRSKVQK